MKNLFLHIKPGINHFFCLIVYFITMVMCLLPIMVWQHIETTIKVLNILFAIVLIIMMILNLWRSHYWHATTGLAYGHQWTLLIGILATTWIVFFSGISVNAVEPNGTKTSLQPNQIKNVWFYGILTYYDLYYMLFFNPHNAQRRKERLEELRSQKRVKKARKRTRNLHPKIFINS